MFFCFSSSRSSFHDRCRYLNEVILTVSETISNQQAECPNSISDIEDSWEDVAVTNSEVEKDYESNGEPKIIAPRVKVKAVADSAASCSLFINRKLD